MIWNWQKNNWGDFQYDTANLAAWENDFLASSGEIIGVLKHLDKEEETKIRIALLRNEAMQTSQIEGELLDRDSVQSSVRRHFGLQSDKSNTKFKEQGISDLLVDVYQNFDAPLSHDLLSQWHNKLFAHQREDAGSYRTHTEPMQVVSGAIYAPKVHFEAPPSAQVHAELEAFIQWYNLAHTEATIPPLTLAGIAHLWFESIHPFEDGNGRIGRALAEKSLSQSLGKPSLISLSTIIEKNKNDYYSALEAANKSNEITKWLKYFLPTILEAQQYTLEQIEFIIKKGKLLAKHSSDLNERQLKVILRIFKEGIEGFTGGLSASNYINITQTSSATATRDLIDLLNKGILTKTGERKHTRYWLNM